MNARQKAKKYKRMYEELLRKPVRFKMGRHKIDTLRFERFYPAALVTQEYSDYLREVIVKDIAQGIASSLDKYIVYNTKFCPNINKYRFYGEIKIVESEDI